jgi:nucleotide-binding universal stress UspA family protein
MNAQPTPETGMILVPLDLDPKSAVALPVARTMARLTGATLHIVHASLERVAATDLPQRLGVAAEMMSGAVIDTIQAPAPDAIMRVAAERKSLLIVMAMRHGEVKSESGLGSIAEVIARRAPCPVLLVPPSLTEEPWTLRQVLLPQDGTPATAAAIEPICHLAHHANATLYIVHVCGRQAVKKATEPGSLTTPHYIDQPQHEWPVWTGEFVERVHGLCHLPRDVEMRLFLAQGEPGKEIIRLAQAHSADIIAMPWHGALEFAPTLKTVLRETRCPVLILPFDIPPQRHRPRVASDIAH